MIDYNLGHITRSSEKALRPVATRFIERNPCAVDDLNLLYNSSLTEDDKSFFAFAAELSFSDERTPGRRENGDYDLTHQLTVGHLVYQFSGSTIGARVGGIHDAWERGKHKYNPASFRYLFCAKPEWQHELACAVLLTAPQGPIPHADEHTKKFVQKLAALEQAMRGPLYVLEVSLHDTNHNLTTLNHLFKPAAVRAGGREKAARFFAMQEYKGEVIAPILEERIPTYRGISRAMRQLHEEQLQSVPDEHRESIENLLDDMRGRLVQARVEHKRFIEELAHRNLETFGVDKFDFSSPIQIPLKLPSFDSAEMRIA